MKHILNKLFLSLSAAVVLTACEKNDDELTYLQQVDFPPGITASMSDIVLTPDTDNESVITFSWPAVSFPVEAPVTYALQITVPSDTLGTAAWSNAVEVPVGTNALSKSFQGSELNTLVLSNLGLVEDSTHPMVARVVATLDRDVYSNAVAFTVRPYKNSVLDVLYVPGDYQSFNPATAAIIREVPGKDNMFEGYVYMPGGAQGFKFTSAPDWNHTNYGPGATPGTLTDDGNAGNLSIPEGGYYYLTVDLNTNKYTATKTTWSIIGDATPGGWNSDTQLTYDPATQVWRTTTTLSSGGSFKFRANNAWTIDFGIDPDTRELVYADNPFVGYTPDLANLSVTESGNYTVTLDLHNPGMYTYTLQKN